MLPGMWSNSQGPSMHISTCRNRHWYSPDGFSSKFKAWYCQATSGPESPYFSTTTTFISQTQPPSFSTPTTLLLNSNQQHLCPLWVLVALAPKWWNEKATEELKVEDYPTPRWSASKQPHNPEKRSDNWRRSYQLRRNVFDFDLSKKCVDSLQAVKSSNFNKYNSRCCDILIVLLQSIY